MKPSHYYVLTVLLGLAAFNVYTSFYQTIRQISTPSFPMHRLSEAFVPLQGVFANQRTASYLTDKDMEIPIAIAQYELAQFVLAPTVLLLNMKAGPLVLVDATDLPHAKSLVESHGLKPLKMSNAGLILAIQPENSTP